MFKLPDYMTTLSLKLSDVLEDIGVNWAMVSKRRRVHLLKENIETISNRCIGAEKTVYFLGSQSEGSTTIGFKSDFDIVYVDYDYNVIQDWSEWIPKKINYLVIQNEDVTPGYCFLQLLRPDVPIPASHIPSNDYTRDGSGKILLKNTLFTTTCEEFVRQGPSSSIFVGECNRDVDLVMALPCKSWPQSASQFAEIQDTRKWRSPEMIRNEISNGHFVVAASSKVGQYPELEWRISTSLVERCLIFNFNKTQLQCYILMKMILKQFLNPWKENGLSSFMCKTALLHCIENTPKEFWKENNLCACLTYCLHQLKHHVQNGSCPHFIVRGNNLMAGQFTAQMKLDILRKVGDMLQNYCRYLICIKIDYIGERLFVKLNKFINDNQTFLSRNETFENSSTALYVSLASDISISQLKLRTLLQVGEREILMQSISNLTSYSRCGNVYEKFACRFVLPFLYTTLGIVSVPSKTSSFVHNDRLHPQTLNWLLLGLNSDVTSGRLRLASVFFSTGNIDRTEAILRQTERLYDFETVIPVCGCRPSVMKQVPANFERECSRNNELCIKNLVSFCIKFHRTEAHCIPRELRYEFMRSTLDNKIYRSLYDDLWINFAVVDSLPYLYFLQYKTYSYLQRYSDQQYALKNFVTTTMTVLDFGHRETALNLLGQCMEQEENYKAAFQCYLLSLNERPRNNAAKFHICSLIAKCVNIL